MKFRNFILICFLAFGVQLNAQNEDIVKILKSNYENGTSSAILPVSEDVIALNVNSADFWFFKGLCEEQVGDFLSAKNSLIKAKVNGYYIKPDLYFHLAKAELKLGDIDASLGYIEKALDRKAKPERFEVDPFTSLNENEAFVKLLDTYRPKLNIWTSIFLFIAFQGILLFVIMFFRRKGSSKANKSLGLFVLTFSCILIFYVLYKSRYLYEYPFVLFRKLWVPALFILGPLLLFYVKDLFKLKYTYKNKLLHFSLFFIAFSFYASFHLLKPENKLYYDLMDIVYYDWLRNAQMFFYFVVAYKIIQKAKHSVGANVVKWLHYMIYMYGGFVLSFFLYSILSNFSFFYRGGWDYVTCLLISSFIILIGVFGLVQPQIFWGFNVQGAFNAIKYEKSGLIPSLAAELKQKLIELMIDEKAYKNNNLNLEELSILLGTTKHNTSQIINEHFNENFFDFLNDFRIEDAKELLQDNECTMTISEILYEVGFNNKVTFNNAFKKRMDMTPTQFRTRMAQAV
ncbi:AraC family transcriptional regulator [Psychroserpens sp. SPM9]|uniref:helix-turn-helix domain-containing protein n=1 Tax=Psychroserpens sp. SPM9 TaxID=2975598 RepID=UPI0021A2BE83|nr:AraC family transcriptional regulator [Psychroserpens sp. SPM9]MDG5490050.1 AraC family transcriptional regulator [Psychroserpens sp. SPM9]